MNNKKLEWFVFLNAPNRNKIEPYNVFNNLRLLDGLKDICKENNSYEEFSKKLDKQCMWAFWAKSEYEIILTSWPTYISREELDKANEKSKGRKYGIDISPTIGEKIDAYDQLKLNWDAFASYVYSNIEIVKKVVY